MRTTLILLLFAVTLVACQPTGASAPLASPPTATAQVWQVTLLTPDSQTTFSTSAATVGQALQEMGLVVEQGDFTWPPLETALSADLTVEYRPARHCSRHSEIICTSTSGKQGENQ